MSGKLRAGALDRRVELLKPGMGQDTGYTTRNMSEVAGSRRASVKPAMGREKVQGLQLAGKAVLSIWMRSDALTRTIDETWSVRFEGDDYSLVAPPIEVGRREGVELLVERVQA
ncbi:head-tail adaptor protein [Erythrobacter litoralis]|uniref:head-tail adaptor protein n=1 Tax=Erythrobacter litoralis TaxID=39960 RepID=UPI00243608A5|nr:head-tail adaptor protein [Erythrobacter litoralis]MDG6079756.1 head-tail adaptor protein [Erythrobacter litoralis]